MNNKKLFVGGLPFAINDQTLADLFAEFGTVVEATVIMDRDTNRSKGFGFVEMSSEEEAQAAIKKLNNSQVDGRTIVVNVAKPREDRPRRDFNRGGGRGGNRGGGRRY